MKRLGKENGRNRDGKQEKETDIRYLPKTLQNPQTKRKKGGKVREINISSEKRKNKTQELEKVKIVIFVIQ